MSDPILNLLHYQAYSQVIDAIRLQYANWDSQESGYEEDFATHAADRLAQEKSFKKLSVHDLLRMHRACDVNIDTLPHSPRIIICASKKQILDVQAGDTIMTPDGVWQIDSHFQEHQVLNSKEIPVIPQEFIPTSATELREISTNNASAEILIPPLNAALVKKRDALYLGTVDTEIIPEAIRVLGALKDLVEKRIAEHYPQEAIFKTLNIENNQELYLLVTKINNDYLKSLPPSNPSSSKSQEGKLLQAGVGADEESNYYRAALQKATPLQKISDTQLQKLQYACQHYRISERIILAASIEQINEDEEFRLSVGDTIVLPNAVYQYTAAQTLQKVLQANEMERNIPPGYIPKKDSTLKIVYGLNDDTKATDNDELTAFTLSQALNTALKPYSFTYFIGDGASTYRTTNVMALMSSLATDEINRRKLKTNFILKALLFKNDAEFIHFWERNRPDINQQSIVNNYTDYMINFLSRSHRLNFSSLSNTELQTLCEQCDTWSPKVSTRILCCHSVPANFQIGDTLLLPDGIFQMGINSSGKIIKEKIVDQTTMKRLNLLQYLPKLQTEVTVHDDHRSDHTLMALKKTLNPCISKHPQGMYLSELEGNRLQPFSSINIALKNLAVTELKNRTLHTLRNTPTKRSFISFPNMRLFRSKPKVQSVQPLIDIPAQQAPTVSQAKNIKSMQIAGKRIRDKQKALIRHDPLMPRIDPSTTSLLMHTNLPESQQRTFEAIQKTMTEVAQTLHLTLGKTYKTQENKEEGTVKILQNDEPVMETSPKTLAVYKSVLQNTMHNSDKAELFLQALGIPPTEGKDRIEVQGGTHDLRVAIRSLFRKMKKNESDQEDTNTGIDSHQRHMH